MEHRGAARRLQELPHEVRPPDHLRVRSLAGRERHRRRRPPAKVNLIPYNENPGLGFGDPGIERVLAFRGILEKHGLAAMVRKNRGRDISAACGQLAIQGQERSAGASGGRG